MYTDYSNNYNTANKLYLDLIANDLPFYEVMEVRCHGLPPPMSDSQSHVGMQGAPG